MRINNNIMAMNTHRQYGINNTNVSSSVEKLSSGYRINRAGDDAAGLAISEKMRAQIRGLTMASKNSQDAISLVQTAEGALQTTHDILQRMREIAVQSSSDTNESTIDRNALNKEFQALLAEIDDTADKTKFNDQGLINGDFAALKVDNSANSYTLTGTGKAKASLDALTIGGIAGNVSASITVALTGGAAAVGATGETKMTPGAATGNTDSATGVGATLTLADGLGASLNGKALTFTATVESDSSITITALAGGTAIGSGSLSTTDAAALLASTGKSVTIAGLGTMAYTNATTLTDDTLAGLAAAIAGVSYVGGTGGLDAVAASPAKAPTTATVTFGTEKYELKAGQTKLQLDNGVAIDFGEALEADFSNLAAIFGGTADADGNISTTWKVDGELTKGVEFVVQTGANKKDELSINIDKMDSKTLGVYASNVSSREYASNAIKETNDAINKVSSQRADLGALQNRLEFKISNLDTSAENLQSAESRIRDLDMAKEMTEFTKNNILSQAATAMLAQANSLPQGVLQLLG